MHPICNIITNQRMNQKGEPHNNKRCCAVRICSSECSLCRPISHSVQTSVALLSILGEVLLLCCFKKRLFSPLKDFVGEFSLKRGCNGAETLDPLKGVKSTDPIDFLWRAGDALHDGYSTAS